MEEVVLAVPFWLEMLASLTGGISGAMVAVRARYDVFGVVCIAFITGLSGGILRDVLLQDYGIYAFQEPSLIIACVVAGILVFYFGKLVFYLDPAVDLLNNVSTALWAVIGTSKGLIAGLDIIPATIMGTITAVGGGILRDTCMSRTPEAFQAGTLFGSAALFGSLVYALMEQHEILSDYSAITCVVIILVLRYASLFFGWGTSAPRDYSDKVMHIIAKPFKFVKRHMPKEDVEKKKVKAGGTGKYRAVRIKQAERKRKSYEALRKVWRSPGKTSPLPKIVLKDTSQLEDEELKDPFEVREIYKVRDVSDSGSLKKVDSDGEDGGGTKKGRDKSQ